MKLVRYGAAGQEKPGLMDRSGRIRDLSAHVKDITGDVLSPAGLKKLAALEAYKRGEEQSFLTVPEWYIVFNSEEYARHLKARRPSAFPYFRSIREYWHVSGGVRRETRARYPSNWGYDLMLAVIGSSFTVENAVKGGW